MLVVPQGKYHLCCFPQVPSLAYDLFNLVMDDEIHNVRNILKNIDDILTSGANIKEIELLIRLIMDIFRHKGMKIKKSKFNIIQKVSFGGCTIQASKKKNIVTISPEEDKIDELLGAVHAETRCQAQSLVGSLNQLAAWCPGLKKKMPRLRALTGTGRFEWNPLHDK